MERVAFLIEETGERIACLLNPESLVVRRIAGASAAFGRRQFERRETRRRRAFVYRRRDDRNVSRSAV